MGGDSEMLLDPVGTLVHGKNDGGDSPDVLPTITPEQKKLLNQLTKRMQADVKGLNGDFGLGASGTELASLEGLEGIANSGITGQANNQAGIQGSTDAGIAALTEIFQRSPEDINQRFTDTVQDPMLKEFEQNIMPQIQTKYAPQFFGGERREMEARSRDDLLSSLVSARSQMSYEADQSNQANKLAAASQLPGVGNYASTQQYQAPSAATGLYAGLLGTGAQGANIQGRQNDERAKRVQQALGTISAGSFENIVNVGESSSQDDMMAMMPALISAGAMMFSDERLKTDKKKIGKTDKGANIYTFRYKGDEQMRMGVMAQELEKLDPKAVTTVQGVKLVNLEEL